MKISNIANATRVEATFEADPFGWLNALPSEKRFAFLLIHSDDALVWGQWRETRLWLAKAENGEIRVADENGKFGNAPALFAPTLQQLRMFGRDGELLVWRVDGGFMQRWIQDTNVPADEYVNESYMLWGTKVIARAEGFMLLKEGQQGLMHTPPSLELGENERAVLRVRHYIDDSAANGQARLALSRLVNLTQEWEVYDGSEA